MKKQIQADRVVSIREKLEENRKKLESHVSLLVSSATLRNDASVIDADGQGRILSSRIENPLCKFGGFAQASGDKDYVNVQEVVYSISAKLPYIENIPPYTTWIFLDRNQRMAEDQSVVGRRRIYYDPHGSEALICSDSEEDIAESEEEKRAFSEGEDRILRMVVQEHGLGEEVLNIVSQYIGTNTPEIQERCNRLKEKSLEKHDRSFRSFEGNGPEYNSFLGKSLSATLDSFDNLFCRRCLVFDCRLHGCSQSLIGPSEKQMYSSESDDDGNPCSDQCYLRLKVVKDLPEGSAVKSLHTIESRSSDEEERSPMSPSADDTRDEGTLMDYGMGMHKVPKHAIEVPENLTLVSYDDQGSCKKQKLLSTHNEVTLACDGIPTVDSGSSEEGGDIQIGVPDNNELLKATIAEDKSSCSLGQSEDCARHEAKGICHNAEAPIFKEASNSTKGQVQGVLSNSEWQPLEKELYLKGIEIFGRNSCLIARNLLSGLKTCMEVSSYMYNHGAALPRGAIGIRSSFAEETEKFDADFMEPEIPARPRLLRKRGRTRKLKYSWKSAGHPSMWKRIADGKNQSCKQYIPCGCRSMCGKQCPCLHNGNCCEKYCGCSKSCKNRFRGCHCAKSQCRSRQCPCFAAGRECDPDVCRNCWVSCGDGSLGEPPKRGDGQCGNMRLLLRQQQRILLAKSEVAGWGAFLKNPVNKNDYLGEYTGELISHREADKRGKIYDRANSSFLFDLNDQFVLDAYRKGDKLKFANHSSNPNCYAKVMLVAGDHRVGIFAKEHIEASEELFYDYRYGPDQAPVWARKPDGSRGDDSSVSHGRAKKHQSH
ncbi:histone-lysine N-methyltransferase EZA1 isoform X3 [Rhododendron vialii]|nr:histone-lysine N-methyltransferase EZA1 isoform X3 [Rhododendron vialii]